MKTVAQFSAVRKGVLDISLYPISYAGGELPNSTRPDAWTGQFLQAGRRMEEAQVGQKFSAFLAEKGVNRS